MDPDRNAWVRAGGDAERLALLATVGEVAAFGDGEHRIVAGIHREQPLVGTLSGWTGGAEVLAAAQAWLRSRGCTVARGPMELCTWLDHRANLGPFDEPPFAFEPTEPAQPWLDAGFRLAHSDLAAVVEHDAMVNAATNRIAALSTAGWSVRPLPLDMGEGRASEATYRNVVNVLYIIASAAVAGSYGYGSIPLESLQQAMASRRRVLDPRLVLTAHAPDGVAAGLIVAAPDSAQPQRGWFVVTTLAVLPRYRQFGVGTWLVAAAHRAARRAGYKAGVHWLPSGRTDLDRHGGRVIRRYGVFEKPL